MIKRFESETVITNQKHPQMFLAAKQLYDAAEAFNRKTKRGSKWYVKLDFRAIENPFRKYDLNDILYPLTNSGKEITNELLHLAEQRKLKGKFITETGGGMAFGDYTFTYNDIHIMGLIWKQNFGYKIKLTLPSPETAEHDLLLKKINELDNAEDIKDFCLNMLLECFFCNKGCVQKYAYKKKWMILGRPAPYITPACWGFGLLFSLNEESLALTKILIDLLTEIY